MRAIEAARVPSVPVVAGLAIVVLPVALAIALGSWLDAPFLVLAALLVAVGVVAGVVRFARAQGAAAVWIALLALSIHAGELSAISLGGQSGRLLWADGVLGIGVACALLAGRFTLLVPRAPLISALVPLVLWSAVTLLFASDALTGIAELKEWLVALAVGGAGVAFATDRRRALQLLGVVAVTGALIAVGMAWTAFHSPLGPVLAILLKQVDLAWGRTNYLAGLMILALPVALGLVGHAESWCVRLMWLVVLVANATGIVLSASKGAMLSLVLAMLIAFARGGRGSRVGPVVMLTLIAGAAGLFLFGPLQEVIRYRLQASALDYSVSERIDLYRLAWSEFTRHPLTGIGLNNFSVASNRLRGVDTVPHNLELGVLAELGLPGLILTLGWVFSLGGAAWRMRVLAHTPREAALAAGLWAAFLGFAIHNQFESTLYGEQFKILLMLVAAATWRLGQSEHRAECPESAR